MIDRRMRVREIGKEALRCITETVQPNKRAMRISIGYCDGAIEYVPEYLWNFLEPHLPHNYNNINNTLNLQIRK